MVRKALVALSITLLVASASRADTTIYNNTTAFLGTAFANGGSANVGGNTISRLAADLLQLTPGSASAPITLVTFSVANLNAAAVTARARLRFWLPDGTGGAPGTFLLGVTFNPISLPTGVSLFTGDFSSFGFSVPAGEAFWAGVTFDDNSGGTGATQAEIDALGQGLFGPPTVGASADSFFLTSSAGSFLVNDPAGSITNFGGSPTANFGWRFITSADLTAAPEPGSIALFGLGALGLVGAVVRRRR